MATLTDDEMQRIRAELGDNLLNANASLYFDIRSMYSVIRDNVLSSSVAATSSSTTISAAGPTTLTVASATGLVAGMKIQLDSDSQRETVSIRNVSGTTLSVICKKTHSGTYPVEVESALTLVRSVLSDLAAIEQGAALDALDSLGLQQVDEVIWRSDQSVIDAVDKARMSLRVRLASMCGITWVLKSASGASGYEVY